MEIILAKGTALGNMEFLPQSDKDEFIQKDVRFIHTRAVL